MGYISPLSYKSIILWKNIKAKEKLELWVPKYVLIKENNGYAKVGWRMHMRPHPYSKHNRHLRDAETGEIIFPPGRAHKLAT